MNASNTFEGKNFEQALIKAEEFFGLSEEEMIIEVIEEGTNGVLGLGSKPTIISASPIDYMATFAQNFVSKMLGYVGVENLSVSSTFENNIINIAVDSDNNGVLIGKNGKTLNSIVHLTTQGVRTQFGKYYKVSVDVGNYKDARIKQLEKIAYTVSRSVAKTHIEAKLEPMNSYERRIIHEFLANDKYVVTSSAGEEPNRYVVIKLK